MSLHMSDDVSTITFRLPATLREKIKEQAKAEERSEGGFIRFHLARVLSVESDNEDADIEAEEVAQP